MKAAPKGMNVSAVTADEYRRRILRAMRYIEERLDQPLSLDELAAVACFSPYHFTRVFSGMTGETVMGCARRLRLLRAAGRLSHTGLSVVEIALEAGYESHEAFSRAFKARFRTTPTEYRLLSRSAPVGGVASTEPFLPPGEAMDVKIETLPRMTAACLRHVGPYGEAGPTWLSLCQWAGRRGLFGPDTLCIGLGWDDPAVTPPEKIRYDACLTVPAGFTLGPDDGEVMLQELGGGEWAVTRHVGPYEKLAEVYAAFYGGWLPQSGRVPRPLPSLEIYRNDPRSTPPEGLVTDICMPLEPRP